jgi:hypothetical protein
MEFYGITWRRHRRKTDEALGDIVRRHNGHLYRLPFSSIHVTQTPEWGPSQRLGT